MNDDLFADFSNAATGAAFKCPESLTPESLENFSDAVEDMLLAVQMDHLANSRFRRLFMNRLTRSKLRAPVRKYCREILSRDFASYVDEKLEILPIENVRSEGKNPYFIKINHGFWEQILRIGWRKKPEEIGRPIAPGHYRRIYINTCFTQALIEGMRSCATITDQNIRFDTIDFGFSLNNGMLTHREILDGFETLSEEDRIIGRGAIGGLLAFMERGLGMTSGRFMDGGFPKLTFQSGKLAAMIERCTYQFDRIVYVVPPHLQNIRTATGRDIAQTVYQISGNKLLLSWLPTLYLTAQGISQMLTAGEKVLVITQSAVFSAMLGLYLHDLGKLFDATNLPISFLDLGQVLDMANPISAAGWVKVYQPDETLSPFLVTS